MQQSRISSSRRGFVTGTVAAGTAAAAVAATPAPLVAPGRQAAAEPQPKPERGGGYHVSEHVKRYYKTTLV